MAEHDGRMTHCAKCGAELIGSRKFCAACGSPVRERAPVKSVTGETAVSPFAQTAAPHLFHSPSSPPPEPATGSYAPPADPELPFARTADPTRPSGIPAPISPLAFSNVVNERGHLQAALKAATPSQ